MKPPPPPSTMARKFKCERYCDAARFFFCAIYAYPSAMRTEGLLARVYVAAIENYKLGVKRC